MASGTTAFGELCFVYYYLSTLKLIIKLSLKDVDTGIHYLLCEVVFMGTPEKILQEKMFLP